MSHVTDILLCTAIADGAKGTEEHPNADALSAHLAQRHGAACSLAKIDGHAGGNKAIQADVFAAAVDYCDIDALVAAFYAIPWESPECAQLMVKDENWDAFEVHLASAKTP